MKLKIFMPTKKYLLVSIPFFAVLLAMAGCATAPKTPPSHRKTATLKAIDVKAQQRYYDLGLRYYSQENYGQAGTAFQQVVELGPKTSLGLKAQENLKKIERIQKSLEEIKAQ